MKVLSVSEKKISSTAILALCFCCEGLQQQEQQVVDLVLSKLKSINNNNNNNNSTKIELEERVSLGWSLGVLCCISEEKHKEKITNILFEDEENNDDVVCAVCLSWISCKEGDKDKELLKKSLEFMKGRRRNESQNINCINVYEGCG